MPSTVTADFSAIAAFVKKLDKQDATAFRKRIRTVVNTVGADTLAEIKKSSSWSTGRTSRAPKTPGAKGDIHSSIPKATRLKTSFAARSAGVTVTTSAKMAPHARPLEGKNGRGINRHPVFARRTIGPMREGVKRNAKWVYVNQPTKPFFFNNAAKGAADLPLKLREQLNEIANELGY